MSQLNKRSDRQKVLDIVKESIKRGMDNESIAQYIVLAKEYGSRYRIESLVESWIMEGRKEFSNFKHAEEWAETLP